MRGCEATGFRFLSTTLVARFCVRWRRQVFKVLGATGENIHVKNPKASVSCYSLLCAPKKRTSVWGGGVRTEWGDSPGQYTGRSPSAHPLRAAIWWGALHQKVFLKLKALPLWKFALQQAANKTAVGVWNVPEKYPFIERYPPPLPLGHATLLLQNCYLLPPGSLN